MKKYIITALMGPLLMVLAQGQNQRLKKAGTYFAESRYGESTPILNEIAEKKNTTEVYRMAALSASRSGDLPNAFRWYSKLSGSSGATLQDLTDAYKFFLYYGKYGEAEALVKAKPETAGNRFVETTSKEGFFKNLKKDSIRYTISETNLNSGYGEFGPCYTDIGIAYASGRPSTGGFSRKWDWNGSYFLDIRLAEKTANPANFGKSQKAANKMRFSTHEAGMFYDPKNGIYYYTANMKKAPGKKGLVKTGIFMFDTKSGKTTAFPHNSEAYFTGHPSLSADGNVLWFASDMPGGMGASDIWYSKREPGGWGKPVNAGSQINTAGKEMFPHARKQKLYFASDGLPGMGGLDLFESPLRGEVAGIPVNCGYPLNTHYDDFALIADSTGENGYVSSNRNGYVDRIYTVTMKLPVFRFMGTVIADNKAKTKLQDITVTVFNRTEGKEETYLSDEDGNFGFEADMNTDYVIYSTQDKYKTKDTVFYSTMGKTVSENINKDLYLVPRFLGFKGIVKDAETRIGLDGVSVTIKDTQTGESFRLLSDSAGVVNKNLQRNRDYEVICKKKGYLDLTDSFNTKTEKDNITGYFDLELFLEKIKVGMVFEIKDIYYDYNKSDLRPESMAELDKLAEFLKANDIKVELSSHTDSRGNDSYNMKLSQARAKSCVDYLISKGVKPESIIAKGYGESRLVNGCTNGAKCSEEEHQANRRTEVKILKISEIQ